MFQFNFGKRIPIAGFGQNPFNSSHAIRFSIRMEFSARILARLKKIKVLRVLAFSRWLRGFAVSRK